MSCACGRRSIGNTRSNRSGSSSQPPAICGVSEDVAHVSMTSGSPMKPFGALPLLLGVAVGDVGGRVDREPVLGGDQRVRVVDLAVAVQRYQTGNGTPKNRWRLTAQSPFSPSTHEAYRAPM